MITAPLHAYKCLRLPRRWRSPGCTWLYLTVRHIIPDSRAHNTCPVYSQYPHAKHQHQNSLPGYQSPGSVHAQSTGHSNTPNAPNGPPILLPPHRQQQLRAELCRQASAPHHRARAAALASRTSAKSAIPITAPDFVAAPKPIPANSVNRTHQRSGSVSERTDASEDHASSATNGHPSAKTTPVPNAPPRPSFERKQTSTWTTLDMGGMRLKNISQSLFKLDYLATLHTNHNQLTTIPPEISRLHNPNRLDISGNQLVSLPPELGLLSSFRELHAFDNRLELGTLNQLEMLGVGGNPLKASLRAILQKDSTPTPIPYPRDSCPPPPERVWRTLLPDDPEPGTETLSVLCYNILCEKYATPAMYWYAPSWALNWSYRKELILAEIQNYGADFICLQEVDIAQYEDYFLKKLGEANYSGVFSPKSRARTMSGTERRQVDGCAIFFNSEKYNIIEHHLIEFAQAAHACPALRSTEDWFNRVQDKDNIAVAATLVNKATGTRLIIANAHLHWDPEFRDVKLVQAAVLTDSLKVIAEDFADTEVAGAKNHYSRGSQIPLIVCGDFNSVTDNSGVYEYLSRGHVPGTHPDFMGHQYGPYTSEGPRHPFELRSAYAGIGELPITNYTASFEGAIDYIWYGSENLEVSAVLGEVDPGYLSKVIGFPNAHFPSDHVLITAEFRIRPPKESKAGSSGTTAAASSRKW